MTVAQIWIAAFVLFLLVFFMKVWEDNRQTKRIKRMQEFEQMVIKDFIELGKIRAIQKEKEDDVHHN